MVDNLPQQLKILNQEMIETCWSHPRNLVFLSLTAKQLAYRHFFEIGTWMGGVPIILKKIENFLGNNDFSKFTLIENFEDFSKDQWPGNAADLQQYIQSKMNTDVDIGIQTIIKKPIDSIDAIHFDSVKWQYMLIKQFQAIKKYCHENTMFVFDDYIAEWPDVIYCVDSIVKNNSMHVIGAFGPKIYVGSRYLKNRLIDLVGSKSMDLLIIKESIKHGKIVAPGPSLMI